MAPFLSIIRTLDPTGGPGPSRDFKHVFQFTDKEAMEEHPGKKSAQE